MIDFQQQKVLFLGDVHGNEHWTEQVLELLDYEFIYQVGDFGINNSETFRPMIQGWLVINNAHMVVIPGNHENYPLLHSWPINEHGFHVEPGNDRIWYATRGNVWTHCGYKIAALGGAFSIDRGFRKEGKSWWPEETITEEDYEALVDNMLDAGWDDVDLFLSHDIPAGTQPAPRGFANLPQALEDESLRQRLILTKAVMHAAPKLLIHGHWHINMTSRFFGPDFTTECWGLNCDGFPGNFTETLDFPGLMASFDVE